VKRLLIGDLHFTGEDLQRDPLLSLKNSLSWTLDVVKDKKPEEVVILGDLFGVGAYESHVSVQSIHLVLFQMWLTSLESICEQVLVLAGNHDWVDKELMTSVLEGLGSRSRVGYIDMPCTPGDDPDGSDVVYLPWGSKTLPGSGVVISHLDYIGYKIRDYTMDSGLRLDLTSGLTVYNGHYHNPGIQKMGGSTLINVGSLISHDFNDTVGANYVLLIEKGKPDEWIQNPYSPAFITITAMDDRDLLMEISKVSSTHKPSDVHLKIVCDLPVSEDTVKKLAGDFKSYRIQRLAQKISVSRVSKEIQMSLPLLIEAYVDKSGTNLNKDKLKRIGMELLGG